MSKKFAYIVPLHLQRGETAKTLSNKNCVVFVVVIVADVVADAVVVVVVALVAIVAVRPASNPHSLSPCLFLVAMHPL